MQTKEVIDFIRNTFKTNGNIPLHTPVFSSKEKEYVLNSIDSTFVSSVGEYVNKSEQMMANVSGTKRAIAVVNGTSGLHTALMLVGVQANDEVITQSLTFVATANAITYCGANPIFLDVDYDTMGLSPQAVSDFLEEFGENRDGKIFNKKTGKKISAIVPMHTFGFPVNIEELLKVSEKWNIPIVEDAAESLGSFYQGTHTGSFGKLAVFSFNGNKIVTSGGGGMIVTNDESLAAKGKHITTTAKVPHPYEYVHNEIGYNYRMPNLNAALLCAQLEQLDHFLHVKRNLAMEYSKFFDSTNIKFRNEQRDTKANYWLMCVELEDIKHRNDFLEQTNKNGVMTRPIWQLLHRLPMFQNCHVDHQKNSKFLEDRIVNIPSSVRECEK